MVVRARSVTVFTSASDIEVSPQGVLRSSEPLRRPVRSSCAGIMATGFTDAQHPCDFIAKA